MKTQHFLMLLFLVTASSALQASDTDDKLDNAKKVVERIIEAQPPRDTSTGRTPEQAIKEYKESGKAPGQNSLKINPVPSPSR